MPISDRPLNPDKSGHRKIGSRAKAKGKKGETRAGGELGWLFFSVAGVSVIFLMDFSAALIFWFFLIKQKERKATRAGKFSGN